MPELPEVEILARHLDQKLQGRTLMKVGKVHPRLVSAASMPQFSAALEKGFITGVSRRAKYLLVHLNPGSKSGGDLLIAHLGMTGRIFVANPEDELPKHTVFSAGLDRGVLVFEDPRRFGRMTLSQACLKDLGPEPLTDVFTPDRLWEALSNTRQPVKTALLDQKRVAGIGNIYASESLFLARIHPASPCHELKRKNITRLHGSIRRVLTRAIELGASLSLRPAGGTTGNGIFYFGTSGRAPGESVEGFRVYDRDVIALTVASWPRLVQC